MGINQNYGNGNSHMGKLPKLGLCDDKTLGPTVDPSALQGPPGSNLHQSIAQEKTSSRGFR